MFSRSSESCRIKDTAMSARFMALGDDRVEARRLNGFRFCDVSRRRDENDACLLK